jgi:hypothetical protein
MKSLTAYRIISFILLPIAGIFGLMCLFMLLFALVNPALLIPIAIFASTVVYTILSFIFFNKAIENNKKCKPSHFKWIRIAASLSLVFCFTTIFQSVQLLYSPLTLSQALTQMEEMQKKMGNTISFDAMMPVLKGVLYFLVIYCTTLFIHIYETFKLMRMYSQQNAANSNKD